MAAVVQPAWQSVDLTASDGGLASCLEVSRVHQLVIDLIRMEGMETLSDFVRGFRAEKYERQLEAFNDRVNDEAVKGRRVSQARLKAAWLAGSEALKNQVTVANSSSGAVKEDPRDWEDPLPVMDHQSMNENFKTAYNIVIEDHLYPCDGLQARVWREFRRCTLTVTEVGKMRSLLMEKAGKSSETHSILPNVDITYSAIPDYVPNTVVGYYWGLRVMAYAWAKAGNYLVDSKTKEGSKVTMMPLDVALNYADTRLRVAMNCGLPPGEQLAWLERKDRMTRGVMAGLVRQQFPAQEALKQALVDTAADWTTLKGREVVGAHAGLVDPDHGSGGSSSTPPWLKGAKGAVSKAPGKSAKAKGDSKGKAKGKGSKGGVTSKIGKMASTTKDGHKICGAFNAAKGCVANVQKCPQWGKHICGYIVNEEGKICSDTNHGHSGHR